MKHGFTLVELLTVIVIIGILAGLTLSIGTGVMKRQEISRARGEMQAIAQALESYKSRYHEYPAGNVDLLSALKDEVDPLGDETENAADDEEKPFIGDEVSYNDAGDEIIDPWGEPYEYYYTNEIETVPKERTWAYPGFILYSKGPDKTGSLASDIKDGTFDQSDIDSHYDKDNQHDDLIYDFPNE